MESTITTDLRVGQILAGRYEIVQLLGEGGMGAVYKAKDQELERFVAVKVIRPELANREDIVRRFKQELILARQITHKNVIRIYDLNEGQGWKFITMEYVEGANLREYVREKTRLEHNETVEIILQICYALEAAHTEGVIHRDLKPQNVMRDGRGRIVVMDFGLARLMETDTVTGTGALVGTVQYMSPEQALGKSLGPQSDLFTLGMMFYELLTGQIPFASESAVASLVKRTTEQVRPAKEIERSVPDRLNAIVYKALQVDPANRFQSAREMADELEAWLGRRPSIPSRITSKIIPIPRPKMSKIAIGIVLAAIIALGIGFGVYRWLPSRKAKAQEPVSVLLSDFRNETGDPIFDGTLEPTLTIALEDAAMVTAFDRSRAKQIAGKIQPGATALTEDLARAVAGREGINVIISGTITRNGQKYQASVTAIDAATGSQIASRVIDADGKQDVLAAMSQLAATVRKAFGDKTPESVQIAAAETFTASSLEAAHAYAAAQEMQWNGRWDEAIGNYKKAVELDPNLGRAYAGLAALTGNMGKRQQAVEYYKQAMEHIDRMSDREKYRTRGGYFLTIHDPEHAVEQYSALVQQFPADVAGTMNLALAHFYMRDMPKARQFGQRAVEISHNGLFQRNNMALYDVYAGDYDAGAKEASSVLAENPAYVDAYGALAMAQLGKGQVNEVEGTYAKLKAISPRGASMGAIGMADLAIYRGRLDEAINRLTQGVAADLANKENELAGLKLVMLAEAKQESGHRADAITAAGKAINLNKTEHVLWRSGRIFALAKARQRTAPIIAELGGRMGSEPRAYAKLLEGELLLAEGKSSDALKAFTEAKKLADTWLVRYSLGRGYLAAKMFTEAYAEFEQCLNRKGEASAVFLDDVPSFRLMPELYYQMGLTQQGLNSPAASESFRTFLSMQAGGDAPRIAEAKRHANLD